MRNLKRVLSLALASVMTLGMMVVGAGAAKVSDFSDANSIKNEEAATVNAAIGIFEGRDDGSFDPEGVVTRAEMAVIVTKMLYGASFDAANLAGSSKFTDVPTWAEGWVNAAAANGIIVGRGNGIFDPDAQVTTAEAVVMLCKTLGYFKNEAEFGENWKLAAANLASELGIYGNLTLAVDAGLSRDNVSELAFHALTEVVPVKYNPAQDTYFTGSSWTSGIEFNYMNTLAYKNFKLMYADGTAADKAYGRPIGKVWGTGTLTAKNIDENGDIIISGADASKNQENASLTEKIYTESKGVSFTFNEQKKNKDVYDLVGETNAGYAWVGQAVNGAYTASSDTASFKAVKPVKGSNTAYPLTEDGRITEIYVFDKQVNVIYIDQFIAEVSKSGSDSDGNYVSLKGNKAGATKFYTDQVYDAGTYVVVTADKDADGKTVIASMYEPTTVEGKVTAKANDNSTVTVNGVKYPVNHTYTLPSGLVDSTYVLFLDNNGYVVGGKKVESSSSNEYLYVTSANTYKKDFNQEVIAVLADGVKKTITSNGNVEAKDNQIYSYSVNSDGTYKLTAAKYYYDGNVTVKKGNATLATPSSSVTYSATADTVYVDVKNKTIYTGYPNVPDYPKNGSSTSTVAAFVVYAEGDQNAANRKAQYVFIKNNDPDSSTDKSTFVYVTADDASSYSVVKDNDKVYTVYEDGAEKDLTIDADCDGSISGAGVYEIKKVDKDGKVTELAKVTGMYDVTAVEPTVLNYKKGSTTVVNNITDDTQFIVVDDDTVRLGDVGDVVAKEDDNTYTKITVAKASKSDGTGDAQVVFLFVTEQ